MKLLKLELRSKRSNFMVVGSPVIATLMTIITSYFLLSLGSIEATIVLRAIFIEPLINIYSISELLVKAAPLIIIAIGLSFGFRAGVWNIGAEGQYVMGGLTGGAVALYFYQVEGWWLIPLMSLSATLGGMAYAGIAAFLKTTLDVSEILVTLMLTYVAILFLNVMVHGPLRDPDGFNFPESRLFHDSATMPIVWPETRVHFGIIVGLVLVGFAWWILNHTILGYKIKVSGAAPLAARFAGFNEKKNIWFCLLLSGGLAGLAGVFEVAGPIGQLVPHLPMGYGFTAIIVAFLARLHPLGIVSVSLLISLTYIGGENVQIALNLPSSITSVFQGLLLFYFLATEIFITHQINFKKITIN